MSADANMNTVIIAIGSALIASVIAPLMLTWLTGRQHQSNRQQEWDRQDAVEESARQRAEDLLAETRRNTAIGNEVLHLVNSGYTASLQDTLDGIRRELVLIDLLPPSPRIEEARLLASSRIAELEQEITERTRFAELAASVKVDDVITNIDEVGRDTNERVQRIEEREEITEDRITAVEEEQESK